VSKKGNELETVNKGLTENHIMMYLYNVFVSDDPDMLAHLVWRTKRWRDLFWVYL